MPNLSQLIFPKLNFSHNNEFRYMEYYIKMEQELEMDKITIKNTGCTILKNKKFYSPCIEFGIDTKCR